MPDERRHFGGLGIGIIVCRRLPSALDLSLENARFRFVFARFVVGRFFVIDDAFILDGAARIVRAAIGVFFGAIRRRLAIARNRRADIVVTRQIAVLTENMLRFVASFVFADDLRTNALAAIQTFAAEKVYAVACFALLKRELDLFALAVAAIMPRIAQDVCAVVARSARFGILRASIIITLKPRLARLRFVAIRVAFGIFDAVAVFMTLGLRFGTIVRRRARRIADFLLFANAV